MDIVWLVVLLWVLWSISSRVYTKKQRDWIVQRDGGRCMFHERKFRNGRWQWVRCDSTHNLEVHHIIPQRWCEKHLPGWNKDIPTNGITLCRRHHGWVHPDMQEAYRQYHKDPDSFKKMIEKRDVLVIKGVQYWVTDWDWMFSRLARKGTARYSRKVRFPRRKRH